MQTKLHSALEVIVGLIIGFTVSVAVGQWIYPYFGAHTTLGSNMKITGAFTFVSFIRGYLVRRLFNWLHTK